jgi:hypothetical protein
LLTEKEDSMSKQNKNVSGTLTENIKKAREQLQKEVQEFIRFNNRKMNPIEAHEYLHKVVARNFNQLKKEGK